MRRSGAFRDPGQAGGLQGAGHAHSCSSHWVLERIPTHGERVPGAALGTPLVWNIDHRFISGMRIGRLREVTSADRSNDIPSWNLRVVIWIDADVFLLSSERELAGFNRFQFMMRLQIWPSPYAAVDDVWQTFSVRYL